MLFYKHINIIYHKWGPPKRLGASTIGDFGRLRSVPGKEFVYKIKLTVSHNKNNNNDSPK